MSPRAQKDWLRRPTGGESDRHEFEARGVRPGKMRRVPEAGRLMVKVLLVASAACTSAHAPRAILPDGQKTMSAEHAVIVEFKYGLNDLGPLREAESRLDAAIRSAGAGEYDGDEVAADLSDGSLYMYGPDADQLYAAIRSVLESAAVMRGATVHVRYGPPGSREKVIIVGD